MKNKKIKKTRKFSLKKFIIFLFFVGLIIGIIFLLSNIKIKNINIYGNKILTDLDVIRSAKLEDYPSISVSKAGIERRLLKNTFIAEANVKKRFFTIDIEIIENKVLFYDEIRKSSIFYNGDEDKNRYKSPSLINMVDEKKYERFIKELKKINENVFMKISEIEYKPNGIIDENRFLFLMSDGNYVYLTLNKFDKVNEYVNIISKLEGKKGILYLDSGSSFEIIE